MDHSRDVACARGFYLDRCPDALSAQMAHRTRLQTPQKPDRPERTAGGRRTLRQALSACASLDDPPTRTARGRVRGLSPLGTCRLTRPGAWRLLRQLVATLRQAIIPQPTIACLRRRLSMLRRHLHEPPRRRSYQKMSRLF